ncbi:MAG TPA: helix-turn-helix transcriptional regulator [Gallionellaceae bacterium]|nr:helix-turn-helix transcriptional regulator [Gallionellaceae bacterium]
MMKLTPFGEAVRVLRMRLDISMKAMADYMQISSSYLSCIEYGDKRLSQKHIDSAIAFFTDKFKDKVTAKEIARLRQAAEQSKDHVNMASLSPDARGLVAAFARRLQEGEVPNDEVKNWITKRHKGEGK